MSTNVSDERAIITIDVELVSSVTGDPTPPTPQDPFLSGFKGDEFTDIINEQVNAVIKDEIGDALEEEGIDVDELKGALGLVKDIDSKGVSNIRSMASNPEGFMENTIISTLARAGPYGALAAAMIAAIAGTPEMVKAVIDALGVKGGPLNQDYAFTEDEQMNQQFDRALQFRRLTGDDPVITVLTKGFVTGDPDFVDNSLVDANTARIGRIGLRQSSLGLFNGI